jgi:hypothetical protein
MSCWWEASIRVQAARSWRVHVQTNVPAAQQGELQLSSQHLHDTRIAVAAGKFGGLFASLPNAMVSGLFCVMFGCICAGGRAGNMSDS